MTRCLSLLVSLALLASCAVGGPQAVPAKAYRVGYLTVGTQSDAAIQVDAFRSGMLELGYIDGQNIHLDLRFAEGYSDRLPTLGHIERDPALAAELVALKPDVLLVRALTEVLALKQVTTSIPIVMAGTGTDPVADGVAASLARPGGNVTGTIAAGPEIAPRRVQLLKDAVPTVSRVAYLNDATNPAFVRAYQEAARAAAALRIELLPLDVRAPDDLADAFAAAGRAHPDAVVIGGGPLLTSQRQRILEFIAAGHWPSMATNERAWADGGALLYYNQDEVEYQRLAASYIDRILKGANPADLSIVTPTKYVFVINLKTARALGVTIPKSVLDQATEFIP